jgi:hypothetical protein
VPFPIKLNCWKHHALFIKKALNNFKSEIDIKQLRTKLLRIGESQMDLYYGRLSPEEVADKTIDFLTSNSVIVNKEYLDWLHNDGQEYRNIKLKDKSVWTLRAGDEEMRYVHIHPGRYSPLTVRVKALTLKTSICALACSKIKKASAVDIDLINEAREKLLSVPPLKSINKERGLGRLINLLSSLNG